MSAPVFKVRYEGSDEPQILRFEMPSGKGQNRLNRIKKFAQYLKLVQRSIDFKVSSRGWCYQLEGFGLITKGEFGKIQNYINEARKRGYLPIDFVAEEAARRFGGVEIPDDESPIKWFARYINAALTSWESYRLDWWDDEEYYIQMLVEKVDLVTLFKPICEEYHIPIGNSRGWSSILQRANMCKRFMKAEERGLRPVLLYCGDHDPYGLLISDLMKKHLEDIYGGTGWWPSNLIIDRFGLNNDFIEENNLSWIENLESGSGKTKYDDPVIQDYISRYGERKCEANALVVRPDSARELCRKSIENYIGSEALERFEEKREKVREVMENYLDENGYDTTIEEMLEKIEEEFGDEQ